jgi:hypothetical protein
MLIINRVEQNDLASISELVNGEFFPWYFNENQINGSSGKDEYSGFTHCTIRGGEINSPYHKFTDKLLLEICRKENIQIKRICRSQFNLVLPIVVDDVKIKNSIHTDSDDKNHLTCLVYLNDSDGDTIFYDVKENETDRITPEKFKYVIFESNKLHSASLPKINTKRLAINFVFEYTNQ